MILLFMFKIKLVAIIVLSILALTSCQTVSNKIDEKDFAVLRAEKAKGRGMGLQDEKVQPGKVMKAKRGKFLERRLALGGVDPKKYMKTKYMVG